MMIVLRHLATGKLQGVFGTDGHDPSEWHNHGAFAPDLVPYLKWDGVDIVVDYTILDALLHARIDREAGEVRARFITAVPGQQATYERKAMEAQRVLNGEPGSFPFLEAEAAASGLTLAALAQTVNATATAWLALAARIEAARMAAKRAVTAAATATDKNEAATIDWDAVISGE